MNTIPSLALNNGRNMPVVGLGTWKSAPGEVGAAVKLALTQAGYTHIDCALVYGNEKEIGQAFQEVFKEGKVKREDVFITSKLWSTHHHRDCVRKGFMQTLRDLQLDYLDLYLIHWPVAFADTEELLPSNPALPDDDYVDTWKEMEKLVDEGLVRAIGVSNFNSKQVQRVLDNCRIKPSIQQIESHVFMSNQPLIDFCMERGIFVTAYSPFASPDRAWAKDTDPKPLLSPVVKAIADKHGKSPAQVILRHAFQRNISVLAKSVNVGRMKENLEIFDFGLSTEEMSTLNGLNTNTRVCPGAPTWRASAYFPW